MVWAGGPALQRWRGVWGESETGYGVDGGTLRGGWTHGPRGAEAGERGGGEAGVDGRPQGAGRMCGQEQATAADAPAGFVVGELDLGPDAGAVLREDEAVAAVDGVLARRQDGAFRSAQGGEQEDEADEMVGAETHSFISLDERRRVEGAIFAGGFTALWRGRRGRFRRTRCVSGSRGRRGLSRRGRRRGGRGGGGRR